MRSFILNALLSSLSLFIMEKIFERSLDQVFGIFLAWTTAVIVTGFSVLIATFTIFRERHSKSVAFPIVVLANMLFGIVYAVCIHLTLTAYHIESSVGFYGLVIGNAFLSTWWGITIAILLDYWNEIRIEKARLIQEASQSLLIRYQQRELSSVLFREIEHEVRAELEPLRKQISAELSALKFEGPLDNVVPSSHAGKIPSLLREGAQNSVRPLSQRLWTTLHAEYPKTPFWKILANIWNKQPFRPVLLIAIDFAGTAFEQFASFGVVRGFEILLTMWLMISLTSIVGNRLMHKYPQWHTQIFFGGIAVFQCSVIIRGDLRELWQPGSVTLSWQITEIVLGVFVILFTSGFGAFKDLNDQVRRTFESEIQHEAIESIARSQQLALIAKESARTLHGSIQTRLVACAMEIERTTSLRDHEKLGAALNEALSILSEPLISHSLPATLQDEIERKVSLWKAFCTFNVNIEEILCSSATAQMVGRIIEEGISNAIRHGSATTISIVVRPIGIDSLEISIVDDGNLVQTKTRGMGTAIIEQASAGKWSLRRVGAETILRVQLPCNETT